MTLDDLAQTHDLLVLGASFAGGFAGGLLARHAQYFLHKRAPEDSLLRSQRPAMETPLMGALISGTIVSIIQGDDIARAMLYGAVCAAGAVVSMYFVDRTAYASWGTKK